MILIYLLTACQPTELSMNSEIQGCSNWNPSIQQESVLQIALENNDLLISRNYVDQYCDAEFTPVLTVDNYKVTIREYWNTNSNDCSTCSAPTVRIENYEGDFFEFWWYIGESSISFNVINTDALND